MKTLICLMFFAAMVLQANNHVMAQGPRWKKAGNPIWEGKRDTVLYLYQLDMDGRLAWSYDNETWVVVPDKQWADYDGKWFRIDRFDIVYSRDGSKWIKCPERCWRGSDGVWYGFDYEWQLWVGGNESEPPLGMVGSSNPYGGTETVNTGNNVNGDETGGYRNNSGNSSNGGTTSTGGYNRNSDVNTHTGVSVVPPK